MLAKGVASHCVQPKLSCKARVVQVRCALLQALLVIKRPPRGTFRGLACPADPIQGGTAPGVLMQLLSAGLQPACSPPARPPAAAVLLLLLVHTQTPAGLSCPCASRPSSSSSSSSPAVSCSALNQDSNGAYGEVPIMSGPISVGPSTLEGKDAGKASKPVDRSKGLWTRCDKCGVILYIKHLKEHHHICFGCNYHLKMTSQERIDHLIDAGGCGWWGTQAPS